ncbi:hypothetical protein CBS9595_001369 [Malassezia furfur]|nr:hypothetical protein CBS9595_001369 [Malassezia furfur]
MGSVPPPGPGRTPSPATPRPPESAGAPHARADGAYTPRPAQYSSPVVTVNRSVTGATPTATRPPFVVAPRIASPALPAPPPPFIVSNSLALAAGLPPRRAGAAPVPAPAPAARLPPHKDIVEGDPALVAQRAHTRQRMDEALAQHHAAALAPDTATPFRNAQDVVARLLPYHVWQAPERDLLTAMDARWAPPADVRDESVTFRVPYKRKRAQEDDCAEDTLYLPPFPSTDYTLSVYRRRADLVRRFAAVQTRASTSHLRAPDLNASLEHLERLVYEDEVRSFHELSNELRRVRAELEEVERQRNWRFGVPATAALHTPALDRTRTDWSSAWAARRFAAAPALAASSPPPNGMAGPASVPSSAHASPIARPYTPAGSTPTRNAPVVAGSAASLPALTHAVVTHLADLTARSGAPAPASPAPTASPAPAASPAPPSLVPSGDAGGPSIPTQPLPLVMPISAVPRLTALGINLVPASHLIPALSLASAGQSMALNPGLTAPRPVVGVQEEPVLLVGITDAPGAPGHVSHQRLHLSVVLAKLRPEQLSGLAALMQALQTDEGSGETRAAT